MCDQLCLTATPWTIAQQAPLSMGFPKRILEWVAMPSSKGGGIKSCIQGSNQGLLQCRQILYHLSHQGSNMMRWYGI